MHAKICRTDILVGQQSFSKNELKRKIFGCKNLKVSVEKKPSWFTGKWKKTYVIRIKS